MVNAPPSFPSLPLELSSPICLPRCAIYPLPESPSADLAGQEELFALAWSVNLTTWPFTPMLAVGGRGRSIYIFVVDFIEERDEQVTMKLRLDRTIVGHGQVSCASSSASSCSR